MNKKGGSLSFFYGSMSSGKSSRLLQDAFDYKQNGHNVLYFTSAIDTRHGVGKITSRIGISSDAIIIEKDDLTALKESVKLLKNDKSYIAVFVDECQFLSEEQVEFLATIVDECEIDVCCYGIRTDFESKLFEGSKRLFELADNIIEMKSMCSCGNNAKMNARLSNSTEKVLIGDDIYKSKCRKCFTKMRNLK